MTYSIDRFASDVALDVMRERSRQVTAEGWTPAHDDTHTKGELAAAAGCYALFTDAFPNPGQPPEDWPWEPDWWKPKDRRRNLVRAAALLLAEIERLDRRAARRTDEILRVLRQQKQQMEDRPPTFIRAAAQTEAMPDEVGEPMTCADAAARASFAEGDLVQLKSGGPAMTVNWVCSQRCEVMWFGDNGGLETDEFSFVCLKPFDGDEIPF